VNRPTEASNEEGSSHVTPHVTFSNCQLLISSPRSICSDLPLSCKSPPTLVASGRNSYNEPAETPICPANFLRVENNWKLTTPVESSSTFLVLPFNLLTNRRTTCTVLRSQLCRACVEEQQHDNRVYTSTQPQNTRCMGRDAATTAHFYGVHTVYTALWHHSLLTEDQWRRSVLHSSL
jgi:hypothetical protein